MPKGVYIRPMRSNSCLSNVSKQYLCFANPALTRYVGGNGGYCGSCSTPVYFACTYDYSVPIWAETASGNIKVCFSNSTSGCNCKVTVVIEGNGMTINRIYVQ